MESFKTYVVIEFEPSCNIETKKWLENKLASSKSKYGANFLTTFSGNAKSKDIFLHIGATTKRLLEGAEELNLKKLYRNQTYREFLVDDMHNFIGSDDPDTFLTQSECLKIFDNELFNLKVNEGSFKLPGTIDVVLNSIDPLLYQLKKKNVIKLIFPLHDIDELKRLENDWYKSSDSYFKMKWIPTESIRNYFGESIAFYFNFYEFYNVALLPVAIIGLLLWILPFSAFTKFAICGIFNLIWSTVFCEFWKRRSAELTYSWGVFDDNLFEKERFLFHGEPGIDPVTNKEKPIYSKQRRLLKKYLISYPSVVFSVFIAFSLMILYYHFQDSVNQVYNENTYTHAIIRMIPSLLYSFIILPLNIVYKFAATWLTEWENHRTQTSFENNLTTKLFIFYFANCFMSLFYEAFFSRNFNNLSNLLISMVIVNALINKISEVIAPYLTKKVKKKILTLHDKIDLTRVEKEAYTLEQYEGTYSDYVTVFEQFGYIALFSAVFPWISLAGFANNLMEQRSDAFKYCHVYNRPFPRSSTGIGPWRIAFEILSFVAIFTNLSLVAVHPDVRIYFSNLTDTEYIIFFIIIEHFIIIMKIAIMWMIPDESSKVTNAKLKYKYDSIQALKQERLPRTTKTK